MGVKVVIAHNRYASAQPSGENAVVDAESALLRAAGVQVVSFQRSSDEIGSMSLANKALLPFSPIRSPATQRALSALLRRERPDVLHLHNPYPLLSPNVVHTAHEHRVPVVQTVHNYRHDCAAGTYLRDGRICHDCHGRRFPTPAIVHGCYRGSRAQSVIMATTLAVHRKTWLAVDRYLALSPAMADFLTSLGIPAERITVKPNAIADPGEPPEVPGEGFFFAGRLGPEKGLELLLAAWERHPENALGGLRIAGDGEQRPIAEQAARRRSDVDYLGRLDPEATRLAMRQSAVVLVPSIWEEPFGLVVVEALANGRPVLVTRRGSLPDLIGADEAEPAGWAVPAEVEPLAAALVTAHRGAAVAGRAARGRYLARYTPKAVTEQLISAYRAVQVPPPRSIPSVVDR